EVTQIGAASTLFGGHEPHLTKTPGRPPSVGPCSRLNSGVWRRTSPRGDVPGAGWSHSHCANRDETSQITGPALVRALALDHRQEIRRRPTPRWVPQVVPDRSRLPV